MQIKMPDLDSDNVDFQLRLTAEHAQSVVKGGPDSNISLFISLLSSCY